MSKGRSWGSLADERFRSGSIRRWGTGDRLRSFPEMLRLARTIAIHGDTCPSGFAFVAVGYPVTTTNRIEDSQATLRIGLAHALNIAAASAALESAVLTLRTLDAGNAAADGGGRSALAFVVHRDAGGRRLTLIAVRRPIASANRLEDFRAGVGDGFAKTLRITATDANLEFAELSVRAGDTVDSAARSRGHAAILRGDHVHAGRCGHAGVGVGETVAAAYR